MATNEPMTDERLAEIRRMDSRAEVSMMASSDVALRDLLAEVDRLRAREQALEAENASMRPIVEAVANTHSRLHCALGCRVNDRWNTEFHAPDCLITQARAFIAAHPATDTVAAESEGE